jgi:hypothetical protein
MSRLEFIAALVSALAWPVALIVVVLLIRPHIPAFLRSLRRVKVGPFEIELERAKVAAEIAASSLPAGPQSKSAQPEVQLPRLDKTDLVGTVVLAFREVEDDLRRRLTAAGIKDIDGRTASQLVSIGVAQGLFTEATAEAVRGVAILRNLAAHGQDDDLTPDKVADYLNLVEAVLYTLRQKPPKSRQS